MSKAVKTNSPFITTLEKVDAIYTYGVDLDNATCFIAGEIDMSFTIALRMKVSMIKTYWKDELKKELKEISLICNSVGGDATIILSMIDYYEELNKEGILVNIHFEGNCMSAATFICCAATGKRSAGKRCRFMIHEVQVAPPEGSFTQAKAFAQETSFLQKEMLREYSQQTQYRNSKKSPTPKDIKFWQELSAKETYLSADRAKELGLIDLIA